MCIDQVNRLIVIGMLILVTGCANRLEVPVPAEQKDKNALDRAVRIFHQAEGLGAKSAAPKSYQKAQQALENAMAIISREPENKEAVENIVKQFVFEAEHLLHITQEVEELRSVQSHAMENVVLSAEYRLLAISDALRQSDPRNQKLYDQTIAIANAAKKIVSSNTGATDTDDVKKRRINTNELDTAYTRIKQLELQLKNAQDNNTELKLDQKTMKRRVESLERLVLELNDRSAGLEEVIRELKSKQVTPVSPAE